MPSPTKNKNPEAKGGAGPSAKKATPGKEPAAVHLSTSIINASIDGLIAVDAHLRITVWNDTIALWSGKAAEEVAGKEFFEVFPQAGACPALKQGITEAQKGRKSFFTSSGDFYLNGYFEVHTVPLTDEGGKVTGILQILHDVAHRIKAENALTALNAELSHRYKELELANSELATFARIASHDLKEPLRKIYTFAELIMVHEAGKLSNSGRSNFRRIQQSVHRMSLLTEDIANFSQISANNEPLATVPLDTVVFLALEPLRAAAAQSEAVFILDPLPDVMGYAGSLQLLFRQLLSNALKFQPAGALPKIRIAHHSAPAGSLSHPEAAAGTGYDVITVEDNGIGFDPQYSERIFEMFQRLNAEGQYKGSGMGLAIARKIARMHRGFIAVDAAPGAGSRFHVYLPQPD